MTREEHYKFGNGIVVMLRLKKITVITSLKKQKVF